MVRLLDLFCGAGGAAVGYHRAGFTEIVGVDIKPQPRYPFAFVLGDALEYVRAHGRDFDAIHASPPCQGYSALLCLPWLRGRAYPRLIEPLRPLLREAGMHWIIENVDRALLNGITLCGTMFGLPVYRHRVFESSDMLLQPPHEKHRVVIGHGRMVNDRRKGTLNNGSARGAWGNQTIVTVAGGQFKKADGERALGIDWMTKDELAQAIPPAYTYFVGCQLMVALGHEPRIWPPRDVPMPDLSSSQAIPVLSQRMPSQSSEPRPLRTPLEDERTSPTRHPEADTASLH